MTASLATKGNATDVTTSLATKANAADVTTSLATKANQLTTYSMSDVDGKFTSLIGGAPGFTQHPQ